jgi:transposase
MRGKAMPRPKEVIDIDLVQRAKEALNNVPDHKICLRLQAIISSARHPLHLVTDVLGTSRVSLWRWTKRFSSQGVAGLIDAPKGHKPPKLNQEQRHQVACWLEEGRTSQGETIHWTLAKLKTAIITEFGVHLSQAALWHMVRQLGFKQKVPRPRHSKADNQAQESFKKNQ